MKTKHNRVINSEKSLFLRGFFCGAVQGRMFFMHPIIPDFKDIHPATGMVNEAFMIYEPKGAPVPLVVSCPHAGIYVPEGFKETLAVDVQKVLQRGDRYTDWLVMAAQNKGAVQIVSKVAPAYLNVGRAENSIHPDDVCGDMGSLPYNSEDVFVNAGQGQGLVALKSLYGGDALYKENAQPDAAEIQYRTEHFYTPYHQRLEQEVNQRLDENGYCLVFDVHSCPSVGAFKDKDAGKIRKDIILGDRHGISIDDDVIKMVQQLAESYDYSFTVNNPYVGGFITQKYAADGDWGKRNCESLQIEFNRKAIGVDEETVTICDAEKFAKAQKFSTDLLDKLATYAKQKSATGF